MIYFLRLSVSSSLYMFICRIVQARFSSVERRKSFSCIKMRCTTLVGNNSTCWIAPRRILITVWRKDTTKASCFMVNLLSWHFYSEVYAVFQAMKIKLYIKKIKIYLFKKLDFFYKLSYEIWFLFLHSRFSLNLETDKKTYLKKKSILPFLVFPYPNLLKL